MKISKFLKVAAFTLISASAFAATDGTVGTTSTGTSTVSLTIPKLVRITSMADFAFGTYTGTGALDSNDDVNVASNYTGTYQVVLTGSGAASAFTITNGTQTIAYSVAYNKATGIAGGVAATSGTAITAQTGVVKPLATATLNGNIRVQMTQANIQAVDAGTYTGTLTIVVTPE